ncbi:MAG: ABC transporter substrate-binding protein [Microbacterium sp. 71-36]|uniref:ABC transporter substrate-binding protein n=1 Tax=unclassified Microbacterium TaxID=2609290 RepID=UPI00086DE5A0|nr:MULTISPECIES: ABC transporter substrate-binding protein [unclassified Microbacterium]MBN9212743.1 ABC transporter substrate-binding protein [Microbacterium sp.]ODT42540.1 MAG: ABC transporter substrate-binding protein [Microbacterium sp. SCN 71-17]OJV74196.1 MAG: ABC transporter substrate-binding protein [Microbacterium sp. 71-36]
MTALSRRLLALALASAAVPLLSGCFSPGTTAAPDGDDQRISVAMMQPPRSGLNPLSDDAFKLSRWSTAETLVTLDSDGTPEPLLATGWEQVDATTWRFDVRSGVTFHNGDPLTADAVANSLQHAIDATPKPRILNGVDMHVVVDGDAVVVTTGAPDPLLPNRLSSPQLAVFADDAYTATGVSPVGTGTGPFVITAVDGIVGATLDRYDGYWGEKALAAGIDARFVPDGTARAAALRTGDADIVEAIPAGQTATIDASLLHEVAMPRTNTLYLNTASGPFADPAVRAAARAAVDRAAIVSSVYEGRADVAEGLLGPALPWAADLREDAAYRALVDTRPAAAAASGIPITLGTFTDRAELPEVAVVLEQQLEAAGFVVQQDVREYQFIEADALDGRFDAFILSRATVLDSGDPVAYLASDFTCGGGFSIAQLCSPDVDAAVAFASTTAAGADRRSATMAAEARVLATDAAVPLLHERVVQGESTSVVDAARDPRERQLVTARTRIAD